MSAERRVGVISRVPRVGRTKRRLARTVGHPAAADLHTAFVRDELRAIADRGFDPLLLHDPPASEDEVESLNLIAADAGRLMLPGHDLASDLLAAFRTLCPGGPAAIVSGDAPHLRAYEVARAFELLEAADLVLGPCPDGGYWLVAMREPHDVFSGIEMGTTTVFEATRRRAGALGLRLELIAELDDVDTFDDLCRAAPHLPRGGHTREALAALLDERPDLAPPLPRRLHLELTNRCNSLCRTCLRTARPEPERDMEIADAIGVLDQLPGLESVALQVNGEPLLYPELISVIAHGKALGVFVEINTNGIALLGARARALLDSGLDHLHVSIDAATAATYARVRGVDAFDTVVANLESLAGARRERAVTPSLTLWMTAGRHNLAELPALVELAARVGAEAVFLQRLVFFGANLARREDSLHGALSAAHEATLAAASERAQALGLALLASGGHTPREMLSDLGDDAPWQDCRRSWESAVVMADGRAVACCLGTFHTPHEQITMGEAFGGSFEATWRGDRYRALRRGLLRGDGPPFCRRCGLDWSL